MTSVIVLIIDICIVMLLIGVFNIIVLDASILILLPPLIILAVIIIIWAVRKIQMWDCWDKVDANIKELHEGQKSEKQ